MSIYEKSVRQLMHDMVSDLGLRDGDVVTRQDVVAWFQRKYPKIKEATVACHLVRLSTNAPSRFHYSAKPGEDDLLYKIDESRFRLFNARTDPPPIQEKPGPDVIDRVVTPDPDACGASTEFAYEHDLRDYLARNLQLVEPGLKLYRDDEEDVTGVEFPAGGRYIDILAVDKSNNYVVIELKVSRGYDRVVGQLLRYVSWIRLHHADPGQKVRGVIISREISEDLRLACSELREVTLFEYEMSVSLKRVALES